MVQVTHSASSKFENILNLVWRPSDFGIMDIFDNFKYNGSNPKSSYVQSFRDLEFRNKEFTGSIDNVQMGISQVKKF